MTIDYPELLLFARQVGWSFDEELDALEVPIGEEKPTTSLSEFVNFLRGGAGSLATDRLASNMDRSGERHQGSACASDSCDISD